MSPAIDHVPVSPVDTTTRDFALDPIGNYDLIRRAGRLVYVPGARSLLVTSHRDVTAALRDPSLHSVNYPAAWHKLEKVLGRDYTSAIRLLSYMPFSHEGKKHQQLRSALATAVAPFAGGNPIFAKNVAVKIARIRRHGGADLAKDLSRHLLFDIMCDLMQIPTDDRSQIRPMANLSWAGETTISVRRRDYATEQIHKCVEYLKAHAAATIGNPDSEFLTGMYNALPADEDDRFRAVALFASIMLVMGNDAIGSCVSMGIRRLLDPAKKGLPPAEWHSASEDVIRYTTPVDYVVRVASEDTVAGGCPVDKGEHVLSSLFAANHDQDKFGERTDQITPGGNVGVAFGAGRHLCVGSRISKTIVKLALRSLGTLPTMRLTGDVVHGRGLLVKTLESMPVEFV